MSWFIINCIVAFIVLFIGRKVWTLVWALFGLRMMYSEWAMNIIKERDPELYEKFMNIKREIEEGAQE